MIQPIVHSLEPITLIGAGALNPRDLDAALALAPMLVAADGGAQSAINAGHKPAHVIGDFDSFDEGLRQSFRSDQVHEVAEQDTTDFEKALITIAAPAVVGVGFLGARLDHQMAALHVLVKHAHRAIVLLGAHEVVFHCPPKLAMTLEAGAIVSLFPLLKTAGTSTGLAWPIDGLTLEPGVQIGTSNKATEDEFSIAMQARGLVVLCPRTCLADVMQHLATAQQGHALWPSL